MRNFGSHAITYHAYRVQKWAFLAGVLFALAFIGFAITGRENAAMAVAILGGFALGVSAGAWTVAARFKD